MVARAFGIPNGTDISNVDPISAIALGGRNVGATALMVATSLLANLASNLATLLEYACGSAAAAEQYVLEAIAKRIVKASGTRRRGLLADSLSESSAAALAAASGSDPPTIDLGSAAAVSELADDSVSVAVEGGGIKNATEVSVSAIAAVAGVASGAARLLQTQATTVALQTDEVRRCRLNK